MRNRIVHDYNGVDFELTFFIVKNEIPKLISALQYLVRNEVSIGVLSLEELQVARNSSWYRHVNFDALV